MIKQKQLVPKRRFEGFSDEWEKRNFLDNIKYIIDFRGRTPRKLGLDWSERGYLALSALNVKNGYIDYNLDAHYGNQELYDRWMKGRELKKGQVLFTTEAPMGNVVQVPDERGYILSQRTIAFEQDPEKITNVFLASLLRSHNTFAKLSDLSSGGTAKGVSQKTLAELKVITPKNLREQQKIGQFFKHLDEMIALQQRKIDKTKALKSAYLAEMFPEEGERIPKRRFEGFTNEWEVKILGNIGKTFTGLSGKTKEDFGHGNAEFVTYMNVFNNPISNIAITENVEIDIKQDEVKYGDVLFTTSSETPHEVGMSSVWLDNRPNVYLNSFCFGYRINIKIDYLFIAYLFRSNILRNQMEILAQGISRYNISKNKVMEIKILLPSKKEQQKIGQFFKHLDEMIATHQQKLEKLKATKQAYLHEMFV